MYDSCAATLAEAVDKPGWSISTAGNGVWSHQSGITHDGSDAAQSGMIAHSESTYFETTITGPGSISFWWKVSSEANYDWLVFYIDGDEQPGKISGTTGDWSQPTHALASGTHTLRWAYTKDGSVVSGLDAGWVDGIEFTPGSPPASLGEAVDNTALSWITSGDNQWSYQTSYSCSDGDAAQSGPITHYQGTYLETSVNGPGTLTFYWKVDSETSYDFLRFYIDGNQQNAISGYEDWALQSYPISSGAHTLRWEYTKDGSVDTGTDAGWVDLVQYTAGGGSTPPVITMQPQSQTVAQGLATSFSVQVTGSSPFSYQWAFNGNPLSGATSSTYYIASVQPSHAGTYSVTITNVAGSVVSSGAILTLASGGTPLPSGCVAWWKGEDNANDTIGTSHGTVYNGGTYANGKVGRAFSFNGASQHARIPDHPSTRVSSAATFEAWVYPTASGSQLMILGKWDAVVGVEERSYGLAIDWSGGLAMGAAPNGTAYGCIGVTSSQIVPLYQWTHVAGTYDGSYQKMYINGQFAGSIPYSAGIHPGDIDYAIGGVIGGYPPGGSCLSPFYGLVDEVTLYNRALSTNEIQAIYNAGPAGKIPPPPPPTISAQPQTQIVDQNAIGTFTVSAIGSGLSYQWYKNSLSTPVGGNSNSLAVPSAQPADAASYFVRVSNAGGSVDSSQASLVVITNQPQSQTVPQGSTASFFVGVASYPLMPTYQWRKDGQNITGATSSTYSKSNIQLSDAGTYTVVVTVAGVSATRDAVLTVPLDSEPDGLPDAWELQYFGNLNATADADPDADDLTNAEEYLYDYDPVNAHTGGSIANDGDKDLDGDLLSNVAELRHYGSDPTNANTFSAKTDAEYKTTARVGECDTQVRLLGPYGSGGVDYVQGNGWIEFHIEGATDDAAYDLYIRPSFNPGTRWTRFYSGSPGQTILTCPEPALGGMNFFEIGLASDHDGDGLTDGYECLVSKTGLDVRRTDLDDMPDGWEVEYGLLPTSTTGNDGNDGNPDSDLLSNQSEWNNGVNSTDPKRHNGTQTPRPVISVTVSDPVGSETGDPAEFQITRTGGTTTDMTVYYVLGGSALKGPDFTLNPSPSGQYPGYSVIIPAGSPSVTLQINPLSDAWAEGTETVIIGVAPDPNEQYVVAIHPHRATAMVLDRVCHTHESNADFNSGLLLGMEARNDRVYLKASSHPQFGYLNVACSVRGTVARIDVNATPPKVIGEYRTSPDNIVGDPSRTTVDQYGNVWVANRQDWVGAAGGANFGSITRIGLVYGWASAWRKNADGTFTRDDEHGNFLLGPFAYNTCLDRDGDGYIRTSRGLADILRWRNERGLARDVDTMGGVSTAEDEAITEYVRVEGEGTRTIAVDKFNDIWVGGTGTRQHQKVDGVIALPVAGTLLGPGCGGYGGLIGPNGVLWSSGGQDSTLLRFVPPGSPQCLGSLRGNYGLGIDPQTGRIWHTDYDHSTVYTWNPDGTPAGGPFPTGDGPKGIALDNNGNAWIANLISATVSRLRADDGTSMGAVNLTWNGITGTAPTGVAVDSNGGIWVTCLESHNAMRINPSSGAVDASVDLGDGNGHQAPYNRSAGPYNYSDMTGFNNQIVNPGGCPLKGSWTVIEDSQWMNTIWNSVSWDWVPGISGTSFEVHIRASDQRETLSNKPFVSAVNGAQLSGMRGRYLEVRASLTRDACGKEGYLERLTICRTSPTLTVLTGLADQSVEEGQNTQFEVAAAGPDVHYQWFFNGVSIGTDSPALLLPSVDCLDSGYYSVRVSDSRSGEQVEIGPARLDVNPRLITIPSAGIATVYPAVITVSGWTTPVNSVEVILYGFKHDRPDDVDILLVSPFGAIMLMSDAGGETLVQNTTIRFADQQSPPSDFGPISSNSQQLYGPVNYGEQETSFPPATGGKPNPPAGPYSTNLGALSGIIPDGEWRLYIVDDTSQGSGWIAGSWCLILNR